MPAWTANTREPQSAKDLELTVYVGDKRNKKVKAQIEAATKAAALLMGTFEGSAAVTISGHSADEETDIDRITVEVARA